MLSILSNQGQLQSAHRAWAWQVVGMKRCPIVDTWWQTETGAIMITALPGAFPLKPGCATLPFFGVAPVLLDDKGNELKVRPWCSCPQLFRVPEWPLSC